MGFAAAAGVISVVATVAAAAASAYAQYQAGQTQAKILKYSAKAAENQARAAREAADIRAKQEEKRLNMIRARARANAGASGVEVGEGSPLLVMLENARQAQYEVDLIRYSGEVQSTAAIGESKLRMFESRAVRNSAAIGAGTTLLSGVASAAGAASKIRTTTTTDGGGSPSLAQYRLNQ